MAMWWQDEAKVVTIVPSAYLLTPNGEVMVHETVSCIITAEALERPPSISW